MASAKGFLKLCAIGKLSSRQGQICPNNVGEGIAKVNKIKPGLHLPNATRLQEWFGTPEHERTSVTTPNSNKPKSLAMN